MIWPSIIVLSLAVFFFIIKLSRNSNKVNERVLFIEAFKSELDRITDLNLIGNNWNIFVLTSDNKKVEFKLKESYASYDSYDYFISLDNYDVKITKSKYKKLVQLIKDKKAEIQRNNALGKIGINIKRQTKSDLPLEKRLDPSIATLFFNNLEEFKEPLIHENRAKTN